MCRRTFEVVMERQRDDKPPQVYQVTIGQTAVRPLRELRDYVSGRITEFVSDSINALDVVS